MFTVPSGQKQERRLHSRPIDNSLNQRRVRVAAGGYRARELLHQALVAGNRQATEGQQEKACGNRFAGLSRQEQAQCRNSRDSNEEHALEDAQWARAIAIVTGPNRVGDDSASRQHHHCQDRTIRLGSGFRDWLARQLTGPYRMRDRLRTVASPWRVQPKPAWGSPTCQPCLPQLRNHWLPGAWQARCCACLRA